MTVKNLFCKRQRPIQQLSDTLDGFDKGFVGGRDCAAILLQRRCGGCSQTSTKY